MAAVGARPWDLWKGRVAKSAVDTHTEQEQLLTERSVASIQGQVPTELQVEHRTRSQAHRANEQAGLS